MNAVERYAKDEQSLASIVEGYHRHLKLISNFWLGIFNAVTGLPVKSSAATGET